MRYLMSTMVIFIAIAVSFIPEMSSAAGSPSKERIQTYLDRAFSAYLNQELNSVSDNLNRAIAAVKSQNGTETSFTEIAAEELINLRSKFHDGQITDKKQVVPSFLIVFKNLSSHHFESASSAFEAGSLEICAKHLEETIESVKLVYQWAQKDISEDSGALIKSAHDTADTILSGEKVSESSIESALKGLEEIIERVKQVEYQLS